MLDHIAVSLVFFITKILIYNKVSIIKLRVKKSLKKKDNTLRTFLIQYTYQKILILTNIEMYL